MRRLLFRKELSLTVSIIACFALSACLAADNSRLPQQRRRGPRSGNRAYKTRIIPHWFAGNTRFWYRNDLRDGEREFIVVDASEGVRQQAFDHERLAKALRDAGLEETDAERLPIEKLNFKPDDDALVFSADGNYWQCSLKTYDLRQLEGEEAKKASRLSPISATNVPRRSTRTGPETSITFVNRTSGEVELFWLEAGGRRRSYGKLQAGQEREQHTYTGHVWQAVSSEGAIVAAFQAQESPTLAEITGKKTTTRRRTERSGRPRNESSNGKWTHFVRDNNVCIRSKDGETEVQLSRDGSEGAGYDFVQWAPDSKTLVAWRTEPGDRKQVILVESSPDGGGRAKLHLRPYALPGDKFTSYELNLFDVASKEQVKPDVDPVDFGRPRLRWNSDGRRFTYQKTDRGHQRFRVIEVDSHTGDTRTIIDEKTDTFIWTAHTENVRLRRVNWISDTNEIIYASERDGWRHLYLVDAETGEFKNQITEGEYVVRVIDRIDEEKRQIWFRACGRNPDQDPYFIHHYRVNFDGTGLVALTEGNGNHSIQYSPDRKYTIDTYSRVDMAPVHELRRTSDGKKVCKLEEADISELTENGWEAPEVFVAKGRDGRTDIWGIICRPADFDPQRKYPIIEDIYAGPHGSYVPKTFSSSRRYASLTELGFIVVKIDGMGTANRSKAFHDVCWKNLKDAGLPDRILWIKAAAKKYPYMDTSRVGIYGTSAGGQSAAGALLFHPEFYKVAVASCGCHDNRMDKASWNEQWMGYPVGPHYAECSNIDNAHRLQGKLMLIVGEMDRNVPPESTMRFVDALVKADKDFDLIVVPGAGHGGGGSYGRRRMYDFFVEHLGN
ncbi:MAG: prolyl oligopeptidase family serine peptidase [Planctomycetota bacterium]